MTATTTTLTQERIDQLKRDCAQMLRNCAIKPTSVTGRRMIHAFWVGAMQAAGEQPPYVVICLMSGRHEDLVSPNL